MFDPVSEGETGLLDPVVTRQSLKVLASTCGPAVPELCRDDPCVFLGQAAGPAREAMLVSVWSPRLFTLCPQDC